MRAQKALDLVAPGWKTTRNGGTKDDQARMNRSRWSVKNEPGRWVPVAGYRAGSNSDGEAYRCAVLVPDESGRVAVSSKVSVPSERPELVMRLKSEEVNGPHPFGSGESDEEGPGRPVLPGRDGVGEARLVGLADAVHERLA